MRLTLAILSILALAAVLPAQQVEPVVHTLDNGMTFLLLPREGDPNVACGWVAKFGSVFERPGVTGVAHLFEHMMFKGSHTIGTKDIREDLEIIEQLDSLKVQLRKEEEALLEKYRRGEISDPRDPAYRSPLHSQLLEQWNQLIERQRQLLIKDEFTRLYTGAGASSLNAGTTNDFTIYYVNMPSNKLELWFWLESDRLLNPVFREFYVERDVVREERRLRVESTPTGRIEEQFDAMFWQASPYAWPVIGWPADVEAITRDEALEYFETYYAPNNLVVSLAGDFDPDEAKELAERYFGRLERGPRAPGPVRTREVEQLAEKRMIAYADTRPMARIRYHTVPDGHVDEPPLLVLSSILNGRTGRLYKSLVAESQQAVQAGAAVNGMRWDGYFELFGVARPPHKPEDVEQALYAEIEKLQQELVGERELQKVKNQNLADDFRKLESKFNLMFELLVNEALGEWENVNRFSERIQAVSAEDVQRVAKTYFDRENRNVLLLYTKQGEQAATGGAE